MLLFRPRSLLFTKELHVSAKTMWKIFWAGAASFLPLLFIHHIGEEAVYTIITQEVWGKKKFIVTTLYGLNYGRPGVYSWLILLVTNALGESHFLIAARIITTSSTLAMGLTLAWLVRKLFNDSLFAAFAAAVFLSGDTLLQRGWIAYSDSIFALFTFVAMATLWVALEEKRRALLLLSTLGLIGSFLAKVFTGYLFYIVLWLILIWRHPNRRFLFTPWSILTLTIAIAFPFMWNYAIAGDTVFPATLETILRLAKNEEVPDVATYMALFAAYPIRVVWYLMPTSVMVLFCLLFRKVSSAAPRQNTILIAAWTVAINLLPYWAVPASSARYLMPLYPLFGLVMAYIVLNSGRLIIDLSAKALIAGVGISYVSALVGYPLYEHYFRGNYDTAAQAIIARAGKFPIYVKDGSSIGLSIAAELNARRTTPVVFPPSAFQSGFVLALQPDDAIGQVDMEFTIGRDVAGRRTRFLLCRGDACIHENHPSASRQSF
jgi:4-amino-4-deoxy-L-arabinose transferase-like glycosyltransferase